MNEEKYIEITNLTKAFGDIHAVNDLSFSVFKGDIMGFLGPNGAGKSTTIRMLLSLIKPDSGAIKIFGLPMPKKRSVILHEIGALIEEPRFYEYLTAYKNLEILSKISGVKPDSKRIYEVLDLIGLLNRASSKVKTFSHGMKQRLGIAQALVHDPDLLILDEPGNGLDPKGMVDVRNVILRINKELGKTIFISSHILKEVELISNRMVIINEGHKIVEGDVKELLYSGKIKVTIDTSDNSKALKILEEKKFSCELDHDKLIKVYAKKAAVPDINMLLVENEIAVFSINPIKTLEEYFLDMT